MLVMLVSKKPNQSIVNSENVEKTRICKLSFSKSAVYAKSKS